MLHKTVVFITHDLEKAAQSDGQVTILRDDEVTQNYSPQDIIQHSSRDDVFDLVKDIHRAHILKTKAITSEDSRGTIGPSLSKETLLENAPQVMTQTEGHVANVTDDNGQLIGRVNMEKIVTTIARPEIDAPG